MAMRFLAARRWADLPLRGKALVVISLPLVVLLLSLVLIYITERQTARAEEDVRRVLLVQGDIQTVHTLLAEAAASVRGYLLTRREDFLPSYEQATPLIHAALQRLDHNIRDARMREHLKTITPLIADKLDGLLALRNGKRDDPEAITAILIENKQVLDVLREQISAMRIREDALLADRSAAASATRMRLLFATLLAAVCGLLGAIVAVLFLSKGIVARVQQVQGNAQRLALGQPLLPQPPEQDEIGQLGTRLVEAGQLLAERERALRDNEERLRLIIDGVKDYGIFALDAQGYVTTWNAGAERIKGYTEQEILGRHFFPCSTWPKSARRTRRWPCAKPPATVITWKKAGVAARTAAASGPAWSSLRNTMAPAPCAVSPRSPATSPTDALPRSPCAPPGKKPKAPAEPRASFSRA
nr:hypothetical protein GCM10020185_74970 [Pseudomonas brassicacearum subsp. brassicacearum]